MKILLVQPPPPPDYIGFRRAALPEPLALESIGAIALPDHDVRILDLRLSDDLQATLDEFQPDLVAVTCLTTEVYSAQDVLKKVKAWRPEVFTLAGGLHASLLPEDFHGDYVDAIVVGEGEITFKELLDTLGDAPAKRSPEALAKIDGLTWRRPDGEWVLNPPRKLMPSLDSLPMPARHLTARYAKDYFFLFDNPHTIAATSRGCPFKCNFCSVWKFYHKKCRYQSAERVVAEVETAVTRTISFVDDNFLANVPRAHKIADIIRERGIKKEFGMQARTDTISKHPDLLKKWREIGLETVLIGFESASQEKLDSVAKGATVEQNERAMDLLNSLGVLMWGAFIVDPQFTHEDFKQLKTYREEKSIIYPQFTILTPLPGTDLYRDRYNELVTHDYRLFDALHAVLPTRLPREEFYKEFAGLYRPDNPGLVYDWISTGRITMERARKARKILMELGNYENFLQGERAVGFSPDTGGTLAP
ncbi:MAG: cobalamin-dependent protein [Planctomycetota bacterium]|nr:cobalamin-dependent protein [Planctomycetota bacterium]